MGILLSACALAPAAPTLTPTTAPSATPTETVVPPTPTETPIPTATVTPTQTPFLPFRAESTVNGLNLRTGPGYLFTSLQMMGQGTFLTVWGRSRGGEWFYVSTPGNIRGWVYGQLIRATHDLQEAPVMEPENALLIRGLVRDSRGTLIQGIVFNVVLSLTQNDPMNTVVSDANGEFFSFMPAGSPAAWIVEYVGIACKSNVWNPPDCSSYKEGYTGRVDPLYIAVSLPFDGLLEFTWK